MTDEDITKIRERAEKATPGPWHVEGAALVVKHVPVEQGRINHIMTDAQYAGGCDRTPDAAFIAHARADVPALLAEVERLRERVDRLSDLTKEFSDENAALRAFAEEVAELNEQRYAVDHDSGYSSAAIVALKQQARALLASEG